MSSVTIGKTKIHTTEVGNVSRELSQTQEENNILKDIVMVLVREISEVKADLSTVIEMMSDVRDFTHEIKDTTSEQMNTTYIGKKPVLLPQITAEVERLTDKEIRALINRAANRQQKGYNEIYAKLAEITGIDVYAVGKTTIKKKDGFDFVSTQASFINTVFKKDIHKVAAAIALDKIRNN